MTSNSNCDSKVPSSAFNGRPDEDAPVPPGTFH